MPRPCKMSLYESCFVLLCLVLSFSFHLSPVAAKRSMKVHDDTFTPDNVLRISSIDAAIACTHQQSTVINGTTPGPVLTLTADETTWVRVYNDMTDQNATIVSLSSV